MQSKKFYIIALSAFFVIALIFFAPGLIPGKVPQSYDELTLGIPLAVSAERSVFGHSQFPAWCSEILLGIPLIDSSNFIFYYPTRILYMLFRIPVNMRLNLDMIIHVILAGLGMLLFLRRLKLNIYSSLFGALVFMTTGVIITFISPGHTNNIIATCLIPYIFFFLNKGIYENRLKWFLAAGLIMGMQMLALGMQITAYTSIFALFYVLYENKRSEKTWWAGQRMITFTAFAFISAVIVSAPQFFPALGYVKESWREAFVDSQLSSVAFTGRELLSFFMPHIYGLAGSTYFGCIPSNMNSFYAGLLPLFLMPFAFSKSTRNSALFFLGFTALFVVLAMGNNGYLFNAFYHIPLIGKMRNPTRFINTAVFCVSILSAMAVHNLTEDESKESNMQVAPFVLVAVVISAGYVFYTHFSGGAEKFMASVALASHKSSIPENMMHVLTSFNLVDTIFVAACGFIIILVFLFSMMTSSKRVVIILCLLGLFHVIDMYRVNNKFIVYKDYKTLVEPYNPAAEIFKKDTGIFRVFSYNQPVLPNKNIYYGVEFLNGYHGMVSRRIYRMAQKGGTVKPEVMRSLNVKYRVASEELKEEGLEKIFSGTSADIYKDKEALPRIYLADRLVTLDNEEAVFNYMLSESFKRGTAVITGKETGVKELETEHTRINMIEYTPSKIELSLNSGNDGFLVISNSYYKRWKAKVNGKKQRILPVNYMVSGIKVKKGINDVVFYYSIFSYIFYMLLGILFTAFCLWYILKNDGELKANGENSSKDG